MIDQIDESKQRLVALVERRRLGVCEHRANQRRVAEEFRRNCGVRADSKRAVIALRGVRGDQLAETGAERSGTTQDFLREPR